MDFCSSIYGLTKKAILTTLKYLVRHILSAYIGRKYLTMRLTKTKNKLSSYRIIALIYVILFSLLLTLSLIFFASIIVGMNKYGGEMADSFGLITIFPFLIHSTVFLIWSYRIYKLQTIKGNTYFQLGLIFLLGLIMPCVIFVRLDLILNLIF